MTKNIKLGLFGAAALLLGLIFVFNQDLPLNPNDDYYERLRTGCKQDACCLASLERMEQDQYFEAVNGACPEGRRKDSLRCAASLKWCERIE